MSQQYHEMQLGIAHASGAEEWYCPTCGRRFLLNWPPKYHRIILDVGDELAIHSGGKGGLRMGTLDVDKIDDPILPEEIRAALEKLLKDFDTDDQQDVPDLDS